MKNVVFSLQGNQVLSKHMNTTHRESHEQTNDVFRCTDCEMQFSERWNLMHHRRDNHDITEICQHFLKGTCKFMPPKSVGYCIKRNHMTQHR